MTDRPSSETSILVVDDTVENLRLLGSMLGEHGYDVRPVTGGRLALRAAEHDPPDLILLDITMPEMDGYEVCQRLKAVERLRDIPVIFLTALNETTDKVKAFSAGGVDYITKPFQFEEVLARVRTHIALRQAQLELLRNYERLRALETLRDDLVHMLVHDMRSPLTALMGNLEFLKDDVGAALPAQSVQDLGAALEGAAVINRMARDLLDISRLEDRNMPLARARWDIAKIADAVRTSLTGWDHSRVIELEISGPIEAECDGQVVQRVLENLVNNAIKHTPSDGRIRIGASTVPGGVRVTVTDEGPGVPRDTREKIFEKFGLLEARKNQRYHSAGLGLAFCKLAVEAHGGHIGVDDGEHGGSVFWFDLPAESAVAGARTTPS